MNKQAGLTGALNEIRRASHGEERPSAPPNFQFEVVRSFPDDPYLFMQMVQFPAPGVQWVTMSLLSMEPGATGRIVHQVTNRQVERDNPDLTRVAGTRALDAAADTKETRAAVIGFVSQVLSGGNVAACADWLDRDCFITHNPYMLADYQGFVQFLDEEMSRVDALRYVCISDVVAYHDFAAVFSVIDFRGHEYRACDLFRVEGGKIVEHWDIAERADNQAPPGNDRSFMPL